MEMGGSFQGVGPCWENDLCQEHFSLYSGILTFNAQSIAKVISEPIDDRLETKEGSIDYSFRIIYRENITSNWTGRSQTRRTLFSSPAVHSYCKDKFLERRTVGSIRCNSSFRDVDCQIQITRLCSGREESTVTISPLFLAAERKFVVELKTKL